MSLYGIDLSDQIIDLISLVIQVLAIVLPVLFVFFRALIQPFVIKSPFLGTWYGFNSSIEGGKSTISRERWKIRRKWFSLRGELIVLAKNMERKSLQYVGKIEFDKDSQHVIVDFKRFGSHEKYTFRFRRTAERNPPKPLLGVWIGRDHDQQMIAGLVLVDRKECTNEEIRTIWNANTISEENDYTFRLRKEFQT